MKHAHIIVTLLVFGFLGEIGYSGCNQLISGRTPSSVSSIGVTFSLGSSLPGNVVSNALSRWNNACAGKKPALTTFGGDITITIDVFNFASPFGHLGFFRGNPETGELTSGIIEIYLVTNGTNPPRGLVHKAGHLPVDSHGPSGRQSITWPEPMPRLGSCW